VEEICENAVLGAAANKAVAAGAEEMAPNAEKRSVRLPCFHCGEPCRDSTFASADKVFCCQGCLVVHDLLAESGLSQFYDLSQHPGVRIKGAAKQEQWKYLDEPVLQQRLLDFTDGRVSKVTFEIPTIHCIACVWLLENLFRLHGGIRRSEVNFPRREVAIQFASEEISLSELVALLASLGYEPRLTLGELEKRPHDPGAKRRWLQLGIAGFAFGNIMLFSVPRYLGLDSLSGPLFKAVFGFVSLALAVPVVFYSAGDYWRSAWLSFRQRVLTLDVPIVLGLVALYGWSAFEVLSGHGEGYLDSLAGLVFFLLCGRVFQRKTHERIAFDRDYKCFFPLSAVRKKGGVEQTIALSDVRVGDRLLVRNGELIPSDARLLSGTGVIDYSFVTGESEPVPKEIGDYLYAGGKQIRGAIEVETVKAVSQSYLTSLWNHPAFQKDREDTLDTMTNRYSRNFTRIVIAVAVGAVLFWWLAGDLGRGVKAFASVLIVACPCALALAAPFTLGTAQRLLARLQVFLRNAQILERMAQVDALVFDKTGTLTARGGAECRVQSAEFRRVESSELRVESSGRSPRSTTSGDGASTGLSEEEEGWVCELARGSTHPLAVRIREELGGMSAKAGTPNGGSVKSFIEVAGRGITGILEGHTLSLGSLAWLRKQGVDVSDVPVAQGSASYLAIDGEFRRAFVFSNALRPATEELLKELGRHYELALLSGDNERERDRFRPLFEDDARLHFNQSPLEKLGFIQDLQQQGRTVMMIGDGLNDAGALKQSDVGVAVVENVGVFSPASDIILAAHEVPRLPELLQLARRATTIVRISFGISGLYNLIGVSFAAAGMLSPVICAILMPVSSISVVLFACGATQWVAKRLGLTTCQPVQKSSVAATEPTAAFPIPDPAL
jgi:Cu+-exporting ATPase